jgi:hypothetical protein
MIASQMGVLPCKLVLTKGHDVTLWEKYNNEGGKIIIYVE